MTDLADRSLAEVTALVQDALRAQGVETVLSGGSCVTVWSENTYCSDDIDLIPEGLAKRSVIKAVMRQLGFSERNRYFVHPETRFWVEYPPGPLAVGEEPPNRIDQRQEATGLLRLLSPTDCIKDRLTWWFHDNDRQGLELAILVAQRHDVDLSELRRWAKGEGKAEAFSEIEKDFGRSA